MGSKPRAAIGLHAPAHPIRRRSRKHDPRARRCPDESNRVETEVENDRRNRGSHQMPDATAVAVNWVEQGLVPDRVVRLGIRRLLKARLAELRTNDAAKGADLTQAFIDELRRAPLALVPEKANEQHYEVPAAFFAAVLGGHRKYSSCLWSDGVETLTQAEAAALRVTCERAG